MPSFASLGIGSNLSLGTLLINLITIEKKRLMPVIQQQSANTSRLAAYGTLRSALEKFQTANIALDSAGPLKGTTATSNIEDSRVSTTAGAVLGEYAVSVIQPAQAQSLSTMAKIISAKEQLGDASVNERTVMTSQLDRREPLEAKLGKGGTSLEDTRDATNDVDSGVSASLMKVREDDYQLALTAESGTESEMAISVSNGSKLGDLLSYDSKVGSGKMKQLVGAQNAQSTVNSIDTERQDNIVTDASQGITLQPTKEVKDASIAVTKSDEKAATAIKAWVEAYNPLVDTFGTLTKYKEVEPGEVASADDDVLLDDSVLRTIQNGTRAPFANSGSESSFKIVSEIDIAQNGGTGKLKIGKGKLAKALKDNIVATRELSVSDGKETGITAKTATEVKSHPAGDGIIDNA